MKGGCCSQDLNMGRADGMISDVPVISIVWLDTAVVSGG
jgi:hypothetical protein